MPTVTPDNGEVNVTTDVAGFHDNTVYCVGVPVFEKVIMSPGFGGTILGANTTENEPTLCTVPSTPYSVPKIHFLPPQYISPNVKVSGVPPVSVFVTSDKAKT